MKKLIALVAAALISLSVVQVAEASDRKTKNTAYILGGVLGGLVLSDVLRNNNRQVYAPAPVYRNQPYYAQRCWTDYRGYYDYNGRFVRSPFTVCEWVRVQ